MPFQLPAWAIVVAIVAMAGAIAAAAVLTYVYLFKEPALEFAPRSTTASGVEIGVSAGSLLDATAFSRVVLRYVTLNAAQAGAVPTLTVGETLTSKYYGHYTGAAVWQLSTDGGTLFLDLAPATQGNAFTWTVPAYAISDNCILRVTNEDGSAHADTALFRCVTSIAFQTVGRTPGMVFPAGKPITIRIDSPSIDFFASQSIAIALRWKEAAGDWTDVPANQYWQLGHRLLQWTPDAATLGGKTITLGAQTTQMLALGFPNELETESTNTIAIAKTDEGDNVTAATDGTITHFSVIDAVTGQQNGTYLANDTVQLDWVTTADVGALKVAWRAPAFSVYNSFDANPITGAADNAVQWKVPQMPTSAPYEIRLQITDGATTREVSMQVVAQVFEFMNANGLPGLLYNTYQSANGKRIRWESQFSLLVFGMYDATRAKWAVTCKGVNAPSVAPDDFSIVVRSLDNRHVLEFHVYGTRAPPRVFQFEVTYDGAISKTDTTVWSYVDALVDSANLTSAPVTTAPTKRSAGLIDYVTIGGVDYQPGRPVGLVLTAGAPVPVTVVTRGYEGPVRIETRLHDAAAWEVAAFCTYDVNPYVLVPDISVNSSQFSVRISDPLDATRAAVFGPLKVLPPDTVEYSWDANKTYYNDTVMSISMGAQSWYTSHLGESTLQVRPYVQVVNSRNIPVLTIKELPLLDHNRGVFTWRFNTNALPQSTVAQLLRFDIIAQGAGTDDAYINQETLHLAGQSMLYVSEADPAAVIDATVPFTDTAFSLVGPDNLICVGDACTAHVRATANFEGQAVDLFLTPDGGTTLYPTGSGYLTRGTQASVTEYDFAVDFTVLTYAGVGVKQTDIRLVVRFAANAGAYVIGNRFTLLGYRSTFLSSQVKAKPTTTTQAFFVSALFTGDNDVIASLFTTDDPPKLAGTWRVGASSTDPTDRISGDAVLVQWTSGTQIASGFSPTINLVVSNLPAAGYVLYNTGTAEMSIGPIN